MSVLTGISSSSSGVSYAMQLAQTSAVKRSLNNLGNAVQNGDLTSAGSILTAFVKANPQYATSSSDASQTEDPINQDFQALADAISNNQVDAAQGAWTQVKSDLAKKGVTDLGNGTAATAKLLAETKASISQQIVSDALGASSGSGSFMATLLGGGGANSATGLSGSLISNWLTYQAGGYTTPQTTTDSAGNSLDTTA
jgi:ABC-type transporter Mla subunit MlaD